MLELNPFSVLSRFFRQGCPAFLLLSACVSARADDGKMTLRLTAPLSGHLTYWFANARQQTEPQPLETPKSGNEISLSVPRAYCQPDATLKILDADHKRIAHLPVNALLDGVTPQISESNLLFSSVWGVNGMSAADSAVITGQWRNWLREGRLAKARHRRVADGRTSPNLLQNADFAAGLGHWNMEISQPPAHSEASVLSHPGLPDGVTGKAIRCKITATGSASWHLQFVQAGLNCSEGTPYTVSFWARSDHARKMVVSAGLDVPPWTLVGMYQTVELSAQWKRYSLAFLPLHPQPNHTRFAFAIADAVGTIDLARVAMRPGVDYSGFALAQAAQIALSQNDFQFSQSAQVPVTAHGLGVAEGRVTLRNQDVVVGTYDLQASDNGAARFADVPINTPLQFTVSASGKTAEFTRIIAEDKPNTTQEITLPGAWDSVKTVAAAIVPAPPAPANEAPANSGNGLLWAALGAAALGIAGIGGYLALHRRPQPQEAPTVLSQAITQQHPSLNAPSLSPSSLNSPLRFPESQPVGARRNGKALPEALPERAGTSAQLVAIAGKYSGAAFPLAGGSVVIGRDAACDVPLPLDSSASRRHAEIRCYNDGLEITDNVSSNGTFVNGVRLPTDASHALRPGDEIEIGASRFRYES